MNKLISFRLPPELIEQADTLAAKLQQTALSDFGGTINRSQVIRRALRLGLAELDRQLKPNQ